MSKKIISNIENQTKYLITIINTDATNYYNRIEYPFTGRVCTHFSLQIEYNLVLLITMKMIKIYLRIIFGFSSNYYDRIALKPFQGDI